MANEEHDIDIDPIETQEWLAALHSVIEREGAGRAHYLVERLLEDARRVGINVPHKASTAYINTIPLAAEEAFPGNYELEKRISSLIRWNAVAMVLHAGKKDPELGGHIATFASAATLYEVGFNHFFHAPSEAHGGDLVYIQGHSAPGIYARAFLEGRLTEQQLLNFRQEVSSKEGISSYPHPWLMPDFWQFPTVSMGLGPLQGIYQARFLKYLHNRGLINAENRKVWVFCGDGEMDEPESLGAITLAARENLDNLIFVVNCNLQRLDGPVRGNGKIIQEFEGIFRGAGWNVIKLLWGRHWDSLLAQDKQGLLVKRMEEAVDGDYQNYKARDGAYVREHFFGKYPELKTMVANMSDEEIWRLNRGGHDIRKVYAAYSAATKHRGQPTVILAKTVKGYGMGSAGEGQNITHQQKKMTPEHLRAFRDRFSLPIPDDTVGEAPFYRPANDSPEIQYILDRRKSLGGYLPTRRNKTESLVVPSLDAFAPLLKGTGDREISSTMAFVRLLNILLKDPNLNQRIVPIVPDETRTFGMEGLFRQIGIYSPKGQLYEPVDASQVMYYREDKGGQFLEEGITEPGSMASWIAAATSYSSNNFPMIPFYVYYSMFGFQRVGDLAWAAGDMQARGFLIGGLSGRTSLPGEGLQHQDGHSHVLSATIPSCVSYDPTFSYELAVIIQEGMRRMYQEQENIFYYITVLNESYVHPDMPEGAAQGILKGMYLFKGSKAKQKIKVQLLGSGAILREVIAAAKLLENDFDIVSDIWSVTSFTELHREAVAIERHNLLHPEAKPQQSYVTNCLKDHAGPVIAATDYIRLFADQIRAYVPQRYVVLGTDGYGRSDTREMLRHFFEVDKRYIAIAALKALADDGQISAKKVTEAIKKYKIDPKKPNPITV